MGLVTVVGTLEACCFLTCARYAYKRTKEKTSILYLIDNTRYVYKRKDINLNRQYKIHIQKKRRVSIRQYTIYIYKKTIKDVYTKDKT